MPDFLEATIGPHRHRGLLLDSNLLVLYVVGQADRRLVRSFKRTREFTDADFRLLFGLMASFSSLVTTPHVLTEVNGLTNQLTGAHRQNVRAWIALDTPRWDERHAPAAALTGTAAFARLGLTDAALVSLARAPDGPFVLSTDGALVQFIAGSGGAADTFSTYQRLNAQR